MSHEPLPLTADELAAFEADHAHRLLPGQPQRLPDCATCRLLATLDAARASRPEPKDATPEPCGFCGRSREACESWRSGVWPCCGLCDHAKRADGAQEWTITEPAASRPEPKDATPEPCGSCGRSRLSCERWEGGVWPCCGLCDHRRAAPAAPEGLREALDAAYRERAAVVAALFRVGGYRTWRIPAPDADGWWIVYADTPQGQVSWHVSATDIRLFDDVPVPVHPDPWDGHTTDEKYERVAALAAAQDTPDPLREDKS